ncbi:MAG: hypothetical protein FJX74_20885 [Armatimonadetes bacterium]|nr:hypothetical protein [Armatimonadota bacterium]
MHCPSCGAQVPVDDLDCTQCGASVGWWVRTHEGEESGPYTFLTMQEMIRQGRLRPLDRVRIGLLGAWVSAPDVLRPTFQTVEPSPPYTTRPQRKPARLPHRALLLGGGGLVLLAVCGALIASYVSRPAALEGAGEVCRANLASLARGLRLYADDFEAFPPWQTWGAAALGYVEDPGVFVCPAAPAEPGYAYNAALSGVPTGAVRSPDRCAVLWDAGALGPFPGLSTSGHGPRHRSGDHWAFVDGHATWRLRGPYPPRDVEFRPWD